MNKISPNWNGISHRETACSYCGRTREVRLFTTYVKQLAISKTPRRRGIKPDRYTSSPRGRSQSPKILRRHQIPGRAA